jgi:hypothetical protein
MGNIIYDVKPVTAAEDPRVKGQCDKNAQGLKATENITKGRNKSLDTCVIKYTPSTAASISK